MYRQNNVVSVADVDYTHVEEELSILPGQLEACTDITILPDSILESDETFNISVLSILPGVNIGSRSEATITITDNDG